MARQNALITPQLMSTEGVTVRAERGYVLPTNVRCQTPGDGLRGRIVKTVPTIVAGM